MSWLAAGGLVSVIRPAMSTLACTLSGSARSGGTGQELFGFRVAAVIDVDARAQGDRARIGGGAEHPGHLIVLTEVERFACRVERGVGAGTHLGAGQRDDRDEQTARDEKLL